MVTSREIKKRNKLAKAGGEYGNREKKLCRLGSETEKQYTITELGSNKLPISATYIEAALIN